MSTTVVVLLVLAGLSESAGRVLPLVARRPKMSARLVAGLMVTGTVVEGTVIALWPLAASTVADLAQPVVAPDATPLPGTSRAGLDTRPGRPAAAGRRPRVPAPRAVPARPACGRCRGRAGRPARRGVGTGLVDRGRVHRRRGGRPRRYRRGGPAADREDHRRRSGRPEAIA